MKNRQEKKGRERRANLWFGITAGTAILLIVVGFIMPPTGVIDGSVLTAVGELMGFAAIAQIPTLIKKGSDVTFQHGKTSVTVSNQDNENQE